jgi:hypothetical protein
MSYTSKYKWIVSVLVGVILLALALMGGKWQISYAADAKINADPIIDFIIPSAVPAGSGNVILIISGENFGESEEFDRIWIKDADHDYTAAPLAVLPTGISVVITDTLLVEPNLYSIAVVQSNGLSIPPIPPNPIYDKVSNFVDFLVFEAKYEYLPLINK